jgi:hypothetical protein
MEKANSEGNIVEKRPVGKSRKIWINVVGRDRF